MLTDQYITTPKEYNRTEKPNLWLHTYQYHQLDDTQMVFDFLHRNLAAVVSVVVVIIIESHINITKKIYGREKEHAHTRTFQMKKKKTEIC